MERFRIVFCFENKDENAKSFYDFKEMVEEFSELIEAEECAFNVGIRLGADNVAVINPYIDDDVYWAYDNSHIERILECNII